MNKVVKNFMVSYFVFFIILSVSCINSKKEKEELIQKSEFIFKSEDVNYPSCHASTIVETPEGLVASWFGGSYEKHPDVGIWVSRNENGEWTKPEEVVNGIQNDTLRYPTWNPVLHYENNKLVLFYKVGPDCSYWWGEMKTSDDFGKTWSNATRFPDIIWGPIRNKAVLLDNGTLLCPSSTEYDGWRVHMEWTSDLGKTWQRTEALNDGDTLSAIQPTILVHPGGKLQILCRTRNGRIYSAWSDDRGETWTKLEPTELPNNNSGIDAVTLKDGRHLLVYNHIDRSKNEGKRNKLHLAISKDGINWEAVALLENDENIEHEYSYPAIIQSESGTLHITYTWRRELIKHLVMNPENISSKPIVNGLWPEI
jgi:predicted neuraminidase